MRQLVWVLVLLMSVSPVAYTVSVSEQVEESLEMWEPSSVAYEDGSLIILAKERRVTDQIYQAMISGICMGMISRPDSLSGVTEIKMLNRFGRQGYVFEGGESDCKELNEMPMNQTEIHILGMTHMHTN